MTLMSDVVALVDEVTLDLEMQAQGTKRVTLAKFTSDAGRGSKTWASGKKYTAVVEMKQRNVPGANGEMVVSMASVTFLKPTIIAEPLDLVTLPGEANGREIVAVSGPIDATGVLLRECYLA